MLLYTFVGAFALIVFPDRSNTISQFARCHLSVFLFSLTPSISFLQRADGIYELLKILQKKRVTEITSNKHEEDESKTTSKDV